MPRTHFANMARSILPASIYSIACKSYDRMVDLQFLIASLGGDLECPFCKKHWKRFRADEGAPSPLFEKEHVIGGGPSVQAVCSWCGSFERERLIYLYLRECTRILDDGVSTMHMAPERRIQKWLSTTMKGKYVSVDLKSPHVDVHADICDLPFADESFDFVICNHVLEHIPNDRQAMRELYRVLKRGGLAILQVPIAVERQFTEEDPALDANGRLIRFGQFDHVRLYGLDYPDRLKEEGFQVACLPAMQQFGQAAITRYGLLADEVLYLGTK